MKILLKMLRVQWKIFSFIARKVGKVLSLSISSAIGAYILLALTMSGWQHKWIDGEIKRAWCLPMPGYLSYIDLNTEPPVVRRYFSMRGRWRVTPWLEPSAPENNYTGQLDEGELHE